LCGSLVHKADFSDGITMLLSFRVANHGSLREPQELNLVPVYADERPALTVAAIFGANASGKSTVLDAMSFFTTAVRESQARWLPDAPIPRRPFLLDRKSRDEPSTYAVDVLLDGVRYVYGFGVTDAEVTEEWLYAYPKARRRVLFERTGMRLEYGASLTGNRVLIEGTMRPNSLYLSAAAQSGHPQLSALWQSMTSALVIDDRTRRNFALMGAMPAAFMDSIAPPGVALDGVLLGSADLGVQGVRRSATGTTPAPRKEPERAGKGPVGDDLLEAFNAAAVDSLEFIHRVGGEDFVLRAESESAGTRTWLHLVTAAVAALASGSPIWIDEIDVSLHPLLTTKLLRLFQDPELNPRGAQLIFTTHSASLLGTMLGEQVLRRDQVWFTEKDPETAVSTLYPLSDFKPRRGENFERRYLSGSYGAVPVLPDAALEEAIKAIWGTDGEGISA